MNCTSIAPNPTQTANYDLTTLATASLSKISPATLLLTIFSVTVWQALLWMPASHPAELPPTQQTSALAVGDSPTTK
jgi:hypothetical protein